MKIGTDRAVGFVNFSTVAAPRGVVLNGKKAWYEITFTSGDGVSQIGWGTSDFSTSVRYSGDGDSDDDSDGVGDCTDSWGFDGQRVCKWFDGNHHSWGKKFEATGGRVLGVAADMVEGKILFGLDGDWGKPMGVAFDNLSTELGLFPALSAEGMKVKVNFGEDEMKFGPPDESYEKLNDIVGK